MIYLSLAAFVFSGASWVLMWALYLEFMDTEKLVRRLRDEVERQLANQRRLDVSGNQRASEAHTTMNCGVDVVAQPERVGLRGPTRASE